MNRYLTRYLTREVLANLLIVTVVMLLVALGGRALGYLGDAVAGKIGPAVVGPLILLRLPEFVQLVLPLSMTLAVLLALGRACSDREMVALHSAGVSPAQLVLVVGGVGLLVATGVACLSIVFTPAAQARFEALIAAESARASVDLLRAARFNKFADGDAVAYVEEIERASDRLLGVFVAAETPTGMTVLTADTGKAMVDSRGARYISLERGHRYQVQVSEQSAQRWDFTRLRQRIEPAPLALPAPSFQTKSHADLSAEVSPMAIAERQWRISLPIMTLVLAVAAVALGQVPPRSGRFMRIGPGIAIFALYFALLFAAREAIEREQLPAGVGLWIVHGVAVMILAIVLWRQQRHA